MYQDFHAMEPDEELDNEAEFMGYYLLAHPSTHSDVSFLERAISHNILLSREVQLAIELRELLQRPQVRAVRGYRTEGGHRCMANFFRRLRTDPYATALVAMVSELQFADVRRDGMQSLDRAYNPSYPFATDDLADWMGLDDVSQAADWAKECGLEVVSIGENGKSLGVRFGRKGADGRTLFAVPDDARARRLSRKSKRLIDEKLELTTVVDMLMGDRKRDLARKTSTLRQSAKPVATARAAPPVQQPLATMSTSASNQFSVPSTKRKNLVTGSDEGSLDLASRTVKTVPDAPRPPLLAIIPEPAVAVAPPKPSLPAFMFGKAVDPQGQGPTDVVRAAVGFPEDRRNHILPEPIPATTRSRQIPKNNSVPSAAPIVPSSISDVNDVPAQAPSLADPRLVSNIAADIMMEVLVQETVHSCSRILSESTVIQSQVMRASVIAVVCDKLLTSIVRDISKELLRDWRRVYKLQLWGFRRWREHCRLRKEVRKAEEQRRDKALQDRTAFLRAIQNLAVTADRRPSLKQRPVNYWGVSPPATAESSEASDRFRNVGLAFSDGLVRNFLPALKHSGGFEMDVFCKIVISTPCLSSPLNQEEWDLVRWTRACFGLGDDVASGNLEYLLDSGDVCVETLLRTMEHPDSNRETFYHVSIQRVESTATVQELDLVRREEGYITGPSAALFLLPSKNPGTST